VSGLTLVIGGARSGKSGYATGLAASLSQGGAVAYVATATADDDEMKARIARHRTERPAHWETIEEPYDVASALRGIKSGAHLALLDCMTLLVTNHLMQNTEMTEKEFEHRINQVVDDLIVAARSLAIDVIVVSNEVGLSLVPEYPLGRLFRDVAGRANQRIAAAADRVVFMVAGIPMVIKGQ